MPLTKFLFIFAQAHSHFRIPELESVAELYGFRIAFENTPDVSRPFMIVCLEEEFHAHQLAQRCILVKSVYLLYANGSSYEELHAQNKTSEQLWTRYKDSTSFKFLVTSFNHKIPQKRQKEVIESFSYMDFRGPIILKSPDIVLGCFEEYWHPPDGTHVRYEADGRFREVFFGKLVRDGSARALIGRFDVKKRSYFGNTSMEAEISLLMVNQTLASPGKLIYDPFVGTGSLIYPAAFFGAYTFGSDIDGRQMRGKGQVPGVLCAGDQYGVSNRFIDFCTFDVTHHPWRRGDLFDAIITDPPYGVRAGAKKLGRKPGRELTGEQLRVYLDHRANPRPDDEPYIPPTQPYELSHLIQDLVLLSRYLLRPQGRLVFFVPTISEEYQEIDIASTLCQGMELVANSLQDFGSWGRRLVTVRKTTTAAHGPPIFMDGVQTEHVPAHQNFRQKYFQGFQNQRQM